MSLEHQNFQAHKNCMTVADAESRIASSLRPRHFLSVNGGGGVLVGGCGHLGGGHTGRGHHMRWWSQKGLIGK